MDALRHILILELFLSNIIAPAITGNKFIILEISLYYIEIFYMRALSTTDYYKIVVRCPSFIIYILCFTIYINITVM